MLKEIDLIAFGRRVHIYNAIKELKSRRSLRTSTTSTNASMMLSPMSGYEPDSPGTLASPTTYQSPESRWDNSNNKTEKLAGLGLDSESAAGSSVRAPSSASSYCRFLPVDASVYGTDAGLLFVFPRLILARPEICRQLALGSIRSGRDGNDDDRPFCREEAFNHDRYATRRFFAQRGAPVRRRRIGHCGD